MNKQAVLNLLGLAFRAQRVTSGQQLVVQAIRKQEAQFVFLAQDLSPASSKELTFELQKRQIPFTNSFSQAELSQAIGRLRKVIAVTDPGFAQRFKELTSIN
ncbi:L7Ae/L30e/S12e/Gadd45 family ribosomal protein [Bombilactobacillus bombi]|uniref:L7Ae/L30e/S12e/Gadd45 family ribosomal protein n=1 Tax=Bombilactobacillus bombi TaxID=1303590 RepID=UPI0015E5A66D|nr:ribosomal L7Ae/L30e/S12e/Gadd45 family protein [Bombilactobacillus bombi]MBA1435026.1 50S ribosomal protein L7 [Bombilactobacillus bombi]